MLIFQLHYDFPVEILSLSSLDFKDPAKGVGEAWPSQMIPLTFLFHLHLLVLLKNVILWKAHAFHLFIAVKFPLAWLVSSLYTTLFYSMPFNCQH